MRNYIKRLFENSWFDGFEHVHEKCLTSMMNNNDTKAYLTHMHVGKGNQYFEYGQKHSPKNLQYINFNTQMDNHIVNPSEISFKSLNIKELNHLPLGCGVRLALPAQRKPLINRGQVFHSTNLFFINALPEPDFKYFSNLKAVCLAENAK